MHEMTNPGILKKVQNDYKDLTEYLIGNNISVGCMESCTSGLIASLITDTPGSSAVFKGGITAYTNEVKVMFGISSETIEKFGVYSIRTAEAMAECACSTFHSDLGIGVTGSLCSVDKNNRDSIPGEVFICAAYKGGYVSKKIVLSSPASRFECKLLAAEKICELIMRAIADEKAESV